MLKLPLDSRSIFTLPVTCKLPEIPADPVKGNPTPLPPEPTKLSNVLPTY